MSDIESTVLRLVEKWWSDLRTERHGLVTSYDPKKHMGKVTFQPEGQESGWLPIECHSIGNGFGIASGINPGDGKTSGDQVVVRYQEGDLDSGKICSGRVFSSQDQPPHVESGELVMWTRFQKSESGKASLGDDPDQTGSENDASGAQGGTGQQIYFKKDGTITFTDGNGATLVMDGKGNVTLTCNNLTLTVNKSMTTNVTQNQTTTVTEAIATTSQTNQIDTKGTYTVVAGGDAGIGASGGIEIAAGGILGLDGSQVGAKGGGSVGDLAVNAQTGKTSISPWVSP